MFSSGEGAAASGAAGAAAAGGCACCCAFCCSSFIRLSCAFISSSWRDRSSIRCSSWGADGAAPASPAARAAAAIEASASRTGRRVSFDMAEVAR